MNRRPLRSSLVASGALVVAGVVGLAAASPALTATDDASTSVRRSVQTLMLPSGQVKESRVYTQVQSSGQGDVSFVERLSGSLRNLNGFGAPASSSDGSARWSFAVDGLSNQRTLQNYPQSSLPITVAATATLDGKPIEIADLVGRTGLLRMTYVITNTTGQDQEISWTDGAGVKQTKTVKVPLPYVGSMDTVLPSSYSEVTAPGASVGGTGRGTTQLSYTLLLYPPLGDTTATISYEARVTDAEVPAVDLTFLPTPPSGNPTTKSALEQYQGGQETGAKLTDGATQIDTNLRKLAAGAGQLNSGLAKLLAGSQTLSSGLNDTAVPGATRLADGAGQLADGLVQLKAGLADLPGTVAKDPDFALLIASFESVIAGIGTPTDGPTSGTLLGGLNGVAGGLAQVGAGLDNPDVDFPAATGPCNALAAPGVAGYCGLKDALQSLSFGLSNPGCVLTNPSNPANPCGALQGVDAVQSSLGDAAAAGGSLDRLIGAAKGAYTALVSTAGCPTTLPGDPGIITGVPAPSVMLANGILATSPCYAQSNVVYGLALPAGVLAADDPGGVKAQSQAGADALALVSTGLSARALPGVAKMIGGIGTSATAGTLLNGIAQMSAGVAQLQAGVYSPCAPGDASFPDNCGLQQAVVLLEGGVFSLVEGISSTLTDNPDLARLVAGGRQLSDGAGQLASGLPAAADGASQIADGLGQAAPGGTQIEDGASRLSTEGTSQLIAAGQDTTNSFGEKAATMEAIDARAADGSGIPNGAVTAENGSEVVTTGAFGYFLDGVAKSDGQNGLRFLLAALLLAGTLGAGVVLGRR